MVLCYGAIEATTNMADDGIVSYKAASVLFGVLFIILALGHFAILCWKRTWHMLWLIVGIILEISAYFQNSAGHGTQSVQVIIAPIFIAASIYMSFGGVLKRAKIPSVINSGLSSFLFIVGDIVSFGLQIAGIVLQMVLDNKAIGTGLVIGGFVLQLISFGCFLTLIILAHKKVRQDFTQELLYILTYFKVLYVTSAGFLVRNLFRIVEYGQGWGGFIFTHTIFVYIFDSIPMIVVCAILAFYNPGFIYEKLSKSNDRELIRMEQNDIVP